MSENSAENSTAARQQPEQAIDPRRSLWPEVWVVLVLGVFHPFFQAVSALCWPEMWKPPSFTADAFSLIAVSISTSILVLYLMSRSGDSWEHFGLQRFCWISDSLLGLMLWVVVHLASTRLGGLYDLLDVGNALSPDAFPRPQGVGEHLLLLVFAGSIGFSEELVMRGYLLPRFERLLGGTWKSLLLTSLLFASYHIYQGPAGFARIVVVGLAYGAAFCLLRRLWPVVVAHALMDVVAYL